MRRAIDYLRTHFAEPVSVGEVAAVAGLSEYHFMRVFRASTALSVHRYLTQIVSTGRRACFPAGISRPRPP
ncbi:AraC family transcriptional regulator [Segnochrobactraceae bacterium EtOH-i3]